MTRKIFSMATLLASLLLAGTVFAQTATTSTADAGATPPPSITFPISELGDCASKEECKVYCDVSAHHDACFAFAETHHLMSSSQVSAARAVLAKKGPGGCSSKEACKAYCTETAHAAECVQFAQTHNLIATSTALLAKKVLTSGGPGGCKNGDECKAYCSDSTHLIECKQFAQDNGGKQQETEQKINQLLQEKPGPGGCTTKDACKKYCSTPTNGEECRQFALENGIISQEQFQQAQSFASTTGPGGCSGDTCKTYCADTTHHDECLDFAVKAGIIKKDVADNAKRIEETLKTSGGPGGCTSAEECKAYCGDQAHQEECSAFLTTHKIPTPGQRTEDAQGQPMPPPSQQDDSSTPDTQRMIYCKEHPTECGKPGSDASEPAPPKPVSGATGESTKVICHTIDECKMKCAGNTANCLYIPNTTSSTQPPPPSAQAPAPTSDTNASTGSDTTKVTCHTIDECKLLCGTNTANCIYIPTTTTTPPPPPPASATTPPPTTTGTDSTNSGSTATKIICHTTDECKVLCGTNTANCLFVPLTTTPPPPTGTTQPPPSGSTLPPPPPPSSTSNLGSALITAFFQFINLW